jgi:cyclic pyranopterin phosphate synthase
MRGHNEQDILPLIDWASQRQLPLRFIEFMPLDSGNEWNNSKVVSEAEILATVATEHQITKQANSSDPATYYQLENGYQLGIIPTISNPFCKSCNRLRLTATGELYACLFSATGRDLRTPLREGVDAEALEAIIRGHVWHKEAGYALKPGYVERPISMHALGG